MTITASPQTDLLVAVRCGFNIVTGAADLDNETWVVSDDGRDSKLFRPSTDLNDAFLAAEKFGLFTGNWHDYVLGKFDGDDWEVCVEEMTDEPQNTSCQRIIKRHVAGGATPALAICSAILKLAEGRS